MNKTQLRLIQQQTRESPTQKCCLLYYRARSSTSVGKSKTPCSAVLSPSSKERGRRASMKQTRFVDSDTVRLPRGGMLGWEVPTWKEEPLGNLHREGKNNATTIERNRSLSQASLASLSTRTHPPL